LLTLSVEQERRVGVVILTAVRFHDQAGITPEEIGFQLPPTDVKRSIYLGFR
jgi:hypothetical protein